MDLNTCAPVTFTLGGQERSVTVTKARVSALSRLAGAYEAHFEALRLGAAGSVLGRRVHHIMRLFMHLISV
jgi:hypothetical protein